ncbi:hypothetical protein S40293_08857 [Stachybotrys chartarum IBT 40293]|nr:hypothetical protein S40293_08857 [Stachybotrys chartarum IBT 40293]
MASFINQHWKTLSIITLCTTLFILFQYNALAWWNDASGPAEAVPLSHGTVTSNLVFEIDSNLEDNDNATQLFWRQDGGAYSCRRGVQCRTQACCGSFLGTDTGTCGFGPTFCGDDCDSQCDARPECGQYADPPEPHLTSHFPGRTCPLNVCCSEFGFCGSTAEFCEAGCQSNCVLNPPIPPGGSGVTVLNNRVIGYYEAWAARSRCRPFPPSAIPVEGLTHVNFAFAYIDPESLEITTMDSETEEALFSQTTDIKNMKSRASRLEVFVAIGGWTFSDNGTATQPVFPDIAADPEKRQLFADNLVSFMTRYGFDGVDLDWEYPGAPDRGGLEEDDIPNFVALMRVLRRTFQASPRGDYGLTFTIPTSYWYLRWKLIIGTTRFDVPGLLEYADWANLMSYDLHGVWDAHNPIGSIVQSHTNLTEIQLAANLLWRNGVPPGQIVFGIGFYGRSFTLQDPDCSTPGCPFSGPSEPGVCTNSAGTLAYFEIMDIIDDENPEVVHDREAAAKYFVFGDNNDQWISFDDEDTMEQKIQWANEVGLGGVMIWAVDHDDNNFSALEALLGEPLPTYAQNLQRAAVSDTDRWSSVNGQACRVSDCLSSFSNPPAGYSTAPNGRFRDRCGSDRYGNMYKYVWCPTDALPQQCEWRGSGSCHGQCHVGEVTLAHSPHGSRSCLAPGQQAFCCRSSTWANLVDGCRWTRPCDDECPSDARYMISTRDWYQDSLDGPPMNCEEHYCCPYDFQGCHWVGQGTCDDNECDANDVQVALDAYGDNGRACAGGLNGRRKPLCCNTPEDLNPFLPVPLDHLFPELPPEENLPAFDHEILSYEPSLAGENPNPMAFFFVVIDGPPSAVSNLNKRDGSHIEFITKGQHHGQEPQTAQFVCMNGSLESNCNDMNLDGIDGTVLRMPHGMGFARYVVAHSVQETNVSVPGHLSKRAPDNAKVQELVYSYNFSRVRRDAGDVYVRIDYSDSHTYFTDIVEAEPVTERNRLKPRFWSEISSVWRSITGRIRSEPLASNQPTISDDNFNVLIYGNDGSEAGCEDDDGFLRISLAGSMRNTMRFGFTLVGTIQPFNLDQAYGYFDSDLYMSAQLSFNGRGILDINSGSGVARDLFPSPMRAFEVSHPGIVSFTPELNAEVSLRGQGEIDGDFTVSFEAGSSETLTTNAPPGLGTFGGEILSRSIRDAADGYLSVGDADSDIAFAMNLNLETTMNMRIMGYETSLQSAGARFSSRTPHAIRVVGNTGSGSPGILDVPQLASSDVIQTGTVQEGWDDGTTHAIGRVPNPNIVFTGGEEPPRRDAPEINGYAVFGDRNFMACRGSSYNGRLVCTYDLHSNDTSLEEPSPPFKLRLKREHLEPLSADEKARYHNHLTRQTGGPSSGSSATYTFAEYRAGGGNVNGFPFETPTYPNGNAGAALDAETGRPNERYSLNDPDDCEDTTITAFGIQGTNWDNVDSDHMEDRSIFPNHFGIFAQSGELDLADPQGSTYRSTNALFDFDNLYNYFASDYRTWVPASVEANPPPGSAAGDVANSLGSTTNPNSMVNLERNLNILKGRLYTTEGLPTADDVFDNWMSVPSQANAEAALSSIRAVFGVFNYMNANQARRQQVHDDRGSALAQFDDLYGRAFPNRPERLLTLMNEFQPLWEQRVTNFAQRPLAQQPGPQQALAIDVIGAVGRMRGRIQNELHF